MFKPNGEEVVGNFQGVTNVVWVFGASYIFSFQVSNFP